MRIYLLGPRAVGKSTLGRGLARALKARFVDTDMILAKRLGCSIADFVARHGWEAFRLEEHAALAAVIEDTAAEALAIIATGGGMVLLEQNRRLMRSTGTCLYLQLPVEEMVRRLSRNPSHAQRPSLTGRDIGEEAAQVAAAREPLYLETAHWVLDARDFTPKSCENILSVLRSRSIID